MDNINNFILQNIDRYDKIIKNYWKLNSVSLPIEKTYNPKNTNNETHKISNKNPYNKTGSGASDIYVFTY